jgi:hypothetical protein
MKMKYSWRVTSSALVVDESDGDGMCWGVLANVDGRLL